MGFARLVRCTALLCLLPVAGAFAQTASVDNGVALNQSGTPITDVNIGSEAGYTIFHVPFSISELGNNTAWVEMDFCSASYAAAVSGGAYNAPNGCTDGYGMTGVTAHSTIIQPSGNNASISGVFDVQDFAATGIVGEYPGTTWTVPARVMAQDAAQANPPFQIGATKNITLTVHGEPLEQPRVVFLSELRNQPSPADGTPGYQVTFRVDVENSFSSYYPTNYAQGTTTMTVPPPADNLGNPALFVSAVPSNVFQASWFTDSENGLPGLNVAFNSGLFDSAVGGVPMTTESLPAVGSSGSATFSIENLFNDDQGRSPLAYDVTYWLPDTNPSGNYPYVYVYSNGSWTNSQNPSDVQNTSAADYIYLLPPGVGNVVYLEVSNQGYGGWAAHTTYDPNTGYPITAPGMNIDPVQADGVAGSWAPPDSAEFLAAYIQENNAYDSHFVTPLNNPKLILRLDPDTEFDSMYTLEEYLPSTGGWHYLTPDVTTNWQLWWSSDQACSDGSFQQTPGGVGPDGFQTLPTDTTQIRCLEWKVQEGEMAVSYAYETYVAVHLKAPVAASLDANPGSYHYIYTTVTGSVSDDASWNLSYAPLVFEPGGTDVSTGARIDTFWNVEAPYGQKGASLNNAGIGTTFNYYLYGPDEYEPAYHNFTNLHVHDVLPANLDIVGDLAFYGPQYTPYVNGTQLITPPCTVTHNTGPGNPAIVDCEFTGTMAPNLPGADPRSDPVDCPLFFPNQYNGDTGVTLWYCYYNDNFRFPIANQFLITVPVQVLGGANGEIVTNCEAMWTEQPAVTGTDPDPVNFIDGYWGPQITAANPGEACVNVTISGSPELVLTKTHPTGAQAQIAAEFSWDVSYSSAPSATAGVTGFYIYDFLGRNLDGTYPAGCATDSQFASVNHISGNPVTYQYTTDNPPQVGGNDWLPLTGGVAPADTTVTGIRIIPSSLFDSSPGAYNPGDPIGLDRVFVTVPAHAGQLMCNAAAQAFDNSGPPAQVTDAPVAINDVANAGGPYTAYTGVGSSSCGTSVHLDGSGSNVASDSTIAWTDADGNVLSTQLSFVDTLAVGTTTLTLTISNPETGVTTSTATINVVDNTAPAMTCPAPVTIPLDPGSCSGTLQPVATATDNCDGAVAASCNVVTVSAGNTETATCTATDSNGNVGSCTAAITAAPPTTSSLAVGTATGTPGTGGAFCSESGVSAPFTFNICGDARPAFSATYSDGSGIHTLPVNATWTSSSTGTLTVDTFGLTVDALATINANVEGLTATSSLALNAAPCSNTCTSVLYEPNKGEHGLVMFEDLWPKKGDLDFNDMTVAYNYAMTLDPLYNVTAIQATYSILAAGADLHSGLKLHFPGVASTAANTIVLKQTGKADRNLTPETGEDDLVITLVPDALALFPAVGFINTVATKATETPVTFTVLIQFATPLSPDQLNTDEAPFDLFIAYTSDPTHQIHLDRYPGTKTMNTSLFGTGDDRSNRGQNANLYFVTAGGLPFGLVLPPPLSGQRVWALETTDISSLYQTIVPWAQSGGTSNITWYDDTNDINLAAAYQGGDDAKGIPVPGFVGSSDGTTDLPGVCSAPGNGRTAHPGVK